MIDVDQAVLFFDLDRAKVRPWGICRGPSGSRWDLPEKRNIAMQIGRLKGAPIFLCDDDMMGIDEGLILSACEASRMGGICGVVAAGAADQSEFGHYCLKSDIKLPQFLSGNLLAVDPQKVDEFFPPIYNEDWLFMLWHYWRGGKIHWIDAPQVRQLPSKILTSPRSTVWQEVGDVIAEGMWWNTWLVSRVEGSADSSWQPILDWRLAILRRAMCDEELSLRTRKGFASAYRVSMTLDCSQLQLIEHISRSANPGCLERFPVQLAGLVGRSLESSC